MNEMNDQKGTFQEVLITKFTLTNNEKGNENHAKSFNFFDEKLELRIHEDKGEIEITFRISIGAKSDILLNPRPIDLQFKLNKDLNYFLSLHESYVLFRKDLKFVYSKIKDKLIKNCFSVTLNLSNSIINHLGKLFISDYNSRTGATSLDNFDYELLNGLFALNLFFNLDEENIILNIPINSLIRIGNNIIKADQLNGNKENSIYLRLTESKTVRKANENDIPLILNFIKELAEFERLLHEVTATEETLSRSLFGEKAHAEVLIYEIDEAPVAFALFFHNFSTFKGKPGLYLEDIYVKPDHRKQGIGSDFFNILAKVAKERDCGRFEWSVLNWNEKAIQFYRKMGAYPMSEWTVYRMDSENINKIADK